MVPATRTEPTPFQEAFAVLERERGSDAVHAFRKGAFESFAEVGIPTTKVEEWCFTNVGPHVRKPYRLARPGAADVDAGRFRRLAPGPGLVFVDGHFRADLSEVPGGVVAKSLAAALRDDPDVVRKHLGRVAGHADRPFAALNAAFLQDGAFVRIGRNSKPGAPVFLTFLSTDGTMGHPRNVLLVEEGAEAEIVETYAALGDDDRFTNAVTEIVMHRNAALDHTRFQVENDRTLHVSTVAAWQDRDSRFTSHNLALGGALARTDLVTALDGEGSVATLNGLVFGRGAQHVDNHTWIEHRKPHCESHELYKAILDGNARGVFSGYIHVFPDAQKTDAFQASSGLLLSDEAILDSQPQLEIYADDVKCSHGSTVGQIDRDALFYLRSRGLGDEQARNLLVHAFAGEVAERIRVAPVRELLDGFLATRLPGGMEG